MYKTLHISIKEVIMKIKILIFVILFCLVLVSFTTPFFYVADDANTMVDYPIFTDNMDTMSIINIILGSFPTSIYGEIVYPDNYAGHYIDRNRNLVVLMVEENDTLMKSGCSVEMSNFTAMMDNLTNNRERNNVHIRYVEFSYRQLHDKLEALIELLRANPSLYNIHGVGFLPSLNRVTVYMAYYTEEQVQHFRDTVMDSPMLIFRQSRGIVPT